MTIEERLKEYICLNYKSIRNFINSSGVDMPYTTLDGILKRGIGKASIDNIFKLCDTLQISADALAEGKIIPREIIESKEYTEYDYIFDQMLIDGIMLNDYEKWNMKRAFHDQADAIRESRERFSTQIEYFETERGKFAIDKRTNRKFFVTKDDTFIPYKNDEFINKIIEEENNKNKGKQ